jgi:hypothetical protein
MGCHSSTGVSDTAANQRRGPIMHNTHHQLITIWSKSRKCAKGEYLVTGVVFTVGLPSHVRQVIANTTDDAIYKLPHRYPAGELMTEQGELIVGRGL